MKFKINVECSPEELRRVMGLPDLTEVHDVYLDKLKSVADKGVTPDMVQQMLRNWMPGADSGMDLIKTLMSGVTGSPAKKG